MNLSGACLQNYRVRISNEALETHFIDQFALLKVDHPRGTQVYPSFDGDIICTGGLSVPGSVINSEGHDISDLVQMRDDCVYRSGEQLVQKISKNYLRDHIDCQLQFPEGTKTISLVLRLRNTLLTTILFYELVLSSQGAAALDWTQKMQNNFYYATIFNELYKSYAGITINTLKGGQWVPLTKIGDIGPIAWKEIAIEIPVEQEKNAVSLRLEFFPDNFMIDYVGYDCHAEFAYSPRISIQQPVSIVDDQKKNRADIENLLHDVDKKYLITNPGESYYITYDLTSDDTLATSVFVKSKGYYIEWIRGSWLTNGSNDYHFSLFDIDKTLNHLRESWLENRPLIEDRFFETRIPLREEL